MGVPDAAETPQREARATTPTDTTDTVLGDVAVKEIEGDMETTPTARTSSDDVGAPITSEKSAAAAAATVGAVAVDGASEAGETEYIAGWKLMSVMFSLTLALFLVLLDMSILATAVPRITTEFHSLKDIGWYGSAYNLASAALQPLSGKLYTYFHAKWVFLACFVIFEIGSLICGVATSSTMFIIGRAVSGIGSSGIQNGGFTIVAACAPLEKRPVLMGILIGICQIGLVGGPTIGGALTQYTTWRWCFYINLPVGAVTIAAILLVAIPDRRKQPDMKAEKFAFSKLDLPGFVLFAPFAIMVLLALEYGGNQYAWNSATVIGLFVGGFVVLVLFVLWEIREGNRAMIPMPVLRKRQIWSSCVASFFLFGSMLGAGYFLPVYFQSVKGKTPVGSGVAMLPAIVSQLAAGVVSGFLMQRIGYYLPFMIIGGVITTIGNGLITTFDVYTTTLKWAGFQVLLGLGRGMLFQAPILAVQSHADEALLPLAMATLVFFQTFGGAVFLSIANSILNNKLKEELVARVPQLNADKIIHAGARGIHDVVPMQYLLEVLKSYSSAVNNVFYAVTAFAGAMFVLSWGMGMKDIRKKKKPVKKGEA